MDEWVDLTLSLQKETGNELSRLSVATVVAEVRREITRRGEPETRETVAFIARDRLTQMLQQKHARNETPVGLNRRLPLF